MNLLPTFTYGRDLDFSVGEIIRNEPELSIVVRVILRRGGTPANGNGQSQPEKLALPASCDWNTRALALVPR